MSEAVTKSLGMPGNKASLEEHEWLTGDDTARSLKPIIMQDILSPILSEVKNAVQFKVDAVPSMLRNEKTIFMMSYTFTW